MSSLATLHFLQGGLCIWCHRDAHLVKRARKRIEGSSTSSIEKSAKLQRFATRDHIVPKSVAPHLSDNLAMACYSCNHRKSDYIIPRWLMEQPDELLRLFRAGSCTHGTIRDTFLTPDHPDVPNHIITRGELLEVTGWTTFFPLLSLNSKVTNQT